MTLSGTMDHGYQLSPACGYTVYIYMYIYIYIQMYIILDSSGIAVLYVLQKFIFATPLRLHSPDKTRTLTFEPSVLSGAGAST